MPGTRSGARTWAAMGDLDLDTRVHGSDGSYAAHLNEDWNIWGPNGGYLGAVLLRAAGTHAALPRPASLAVTFLARATFEAVEIQTVTLRRTRRAEAVRATMIQGDRIVAEALAWFVDVDLDGLEHDVTTMPAAPPPEQVRSWDALVQELDLPRPPFRFWDNIDYRPTDFREEWPPPGPLPPVAEAWFEFRPRAVFDEPLVDAGRLVIVLDTMGWPAGTRAHAWSWPVDVQPWVAPSLDLHVRFHRFVPTSARLFTRLEAPVSGDGLLSAEGRTWSEDGTLLASAASQMLWTAVPPA
ncbi:MAG: acyl-CoA thioesterase [Acidimicrobiales bacterium]|nr:acyl-CoA thioesterase [Acidimicrobiales bacterium]